MCRAHPISVYFRITKTVLRKSYGLCSEVVVEDILRLYSEAVKEIDYRCRHHRRAAHQVEAVLRSLMVLQISLIEHIVDESRRVGNMLSICLRVRPVKGKMELEVREFLFKLIRRSSLSLWSSLS